MGRQGDEHLGLVVADEVPLFVDSGATRLVQAAGFVLTADRLNVAVVCAAAATRAVRMRPRVYGSSADRSTILTRRLRTRRAGVPCRALQGHMKGVTCSSLRSSRRKGTRTSLYVPSFLECADPAEVADRSRGVVYVTHFEAASGAA